MKKIILSLMLLLCISLVPACACNKEETISAQEATNVLKETKIEGNVMVTITTETTVDGNTTTSTQTDTYYNDKYYHTSDSDKLTTKTWYGSVNNSLYAFYYTKNANNEEVKSSSRIEAPLLESTKNQLNIITSTLLSNNGDLLENYTISGTKKGNSYTIQVNNNTDLESDIYTISIKDNKVQKIVKNSSILSDTIKTTYEYNYDVTDFELPSLNEYPLTTNG